MADPNLSFPKFRSRWPWWGRDLQTMRNLLMGGGPTLEASSSERVEFPMRDGSGDVLLATMQRPREATKRPLVILIHGLTGSAESSYVRTSARHLLGLGFPVLRLNLRGAGPTRGRSRFLYHAGRSEDLRQVLGSMDGRLAGNGLFLVGYSLGGNMLLKFLGEAGRRAMVLGAVSISAPIDLAAARLGIQRRRNRMYQGYLLTRLKEEFAALPIEPPTPTELEGIVTIYDFDNRIVAPRAGFVDADDYYRRCMALAFLPQIGIPTLVIHSRDDPWIPFAAYREFAWKSYPRLMPLFPRHGGHVGFHGAGSLVPWHDRCMARFFARLAG
ncbi:MAG TPA: alpha/beta fold hydrolase [Candidatus Udaeobacter sp.]|nr:alpha/beta fold hydrolase [Candidatus Udaeobacter sp.]